MSEECRAGRCWDAADLIGGEDHDFVVDLYLAVLRRWPDPAGYRRYLEQVAGRPERRLEALREVAGSEEAARAGTRVAFGAAPLLPPGPTRALAISLAIRTEWLREEQERHRQALGELGAALLTPELIEARDAALHFEINALRREVTDRLDGLLGPATSDAGAAREAAIQAVSRLVAEHVADRVAAQQAQIEHRFRALEARLLALEARRGA
ncbi:DUF4214 domain-containing protein [Roseicella aerolata]|uniref:DUF4214 domain-containing protein n=1 Tax=Roseicella aerolata TaxID=2883479 RepID=A0A9X1IFA5_9PROT|nr:DUF4214 domain-containing protein [Roseicella aerolata]MCB4823639.1 DUF4214 domain-containing protein [Roseicella aerolata]